MGLSEIRNLNYGIILLIHSTEATTIKLSKLYNSVPKRSPSKITLELFSCLQNLIKNVFCDHIDLTACNASSPMQDSQDNFFRKQFPYFLRADIQSRSWRTIYLSIRLSIHNNAASTTTVKQEKLTLLGKVLSWFNSSTYI